MEEFPYPTKRNYGNYSFGMKLKPEITTNSPGPNAYYIPSTIGPNVPDLKSSPAFSL
jgi:hypothetical protein